MREYINTFTQAIESENQSTSTPVIHQGNKNKNYFNQNDICFNQCSQRHYQFEQNHDKRQPNLDQNKNKNQPISDQNKINFDGNQCFSEQTHLENDAKKSSAFVEINSLNVYQESKSVNVENKNHKTENICDEDNTNLSKNIIEDIEELCTKQLKEYMESVSQLSKTTASLCSEPTFWVEEELNKLNNHVELLQNNEVKGKVKKVTQINKEVNKNILKKEINEVDMVLVENKLEKDVSKTKLDEEANEKIANRRTLSTEIETKTIEIKSVLNKNNTQLSPNKKENLIFSNQPYISSLEHQLAFEKFPDILETSYQIQSEKIVPSENKVLIIKEKSLIDESVTIENSTDEIRDKSNGSHILNEISKDSDCVLPKPGCLKRNDSYILESPSPILLAKMKQCSVSEFRDGIFPGSVKSETCEEYLSVSFNFPGTILTSEINCLPEEKDVRITHEKKEAKGVPDRNSLKDSKDPSCSAEENFRNLSGKNLGNFGEKNLKSFQGEDLNILVREDLKNLVKDDLKYFAEENIKNLVENDTKNFTEGVVNNLVKINVKSGKTDLEKTPNLKNSQNKELDYSRENIYLRSQTKTSENNLSFDGTPINLKLFNQNTENELLDRVNTPMSVLTTNTDCLTSSMSIYYSVTNSAKSTIINSSPESKHSDFSPNEIRALSCSKELFPKKAEDSSFLRKQKAASVIGAYARGYLIRRLMSTERVQNLILTIKESLLCAMQLHYEDCDRIQPADVELHRRLIQQVFFKFIFLAFIKKLDYHCR